MSSVNDPATNTTMKKNANKSSKSSSRNIILKMPQGFFESAPANNYSNILPTSGKLAAIEVAQRTLSGVILLDIITTGNLIEVDKNLEHNVFKNEKNIAAKITWLRKE